MVVLGAGEAMRRREFIACVGSAAVAWSSAARAQQPALPVVGVVSGRSRDADARNVSAFYKGLGEAGYVDGQNVTVEYQWVEGHYDRLPEVMADLVRRQVAVIATTGNNASALAAKAATATIPIVFAVGEDPVKLGLVASLARPGGNATGINDFLSEVAAKRLRLLHDMVPKAARVAVLVNPANAASAEGALQGTKDAAAATGVQLRVLNATTAGEIDAAFASFAHEPPDALFVAADAFFNSRSAQFATLTARERIASAFSDRAMVAAGGLMSYGADLAEIAHQVGLYTGKLLKGAKPADLPVQQSTKFNFAINLQTARALGIEVPSGVLSIAEEVIE
jgi:putative tryptophan/tyrosine transport system substrate-binding protein